MFKKYLSWNLKPDDKYKKEYYATRITANAERLRIVAVITIFVFSGLMVQHLVSPGVLRTSLVFTLYLSIYIGFVGTAFFYLIYDRLIVRKTGSVISQWLMFFIVIGGGTFLTVIDNYITGDISAMLMGLIVMAGLFRCSLPVFLITALAAVAGFVIGSYFISQKLMTSSILVPLIIEVCCSVILFIVITHYDIRTFNLEADNRKALLEKELILKEVHHRIKNNMTTISGLLALQSGTLEDPSAVAALKDADSRVQSMMLLYDKLYQSDVFSNVSIRLYLPYLIDGIIANFHDSRKIKVDKKIDDFVLDANKLLLLGIIINELLTNIMKYAFADKDDGSIKIAVIKENNKVSLTIEDNGNGIPESVNFEHSTGFGLKMIVMMTKQLGGSIRLERENGTRIILDFTN